MKAIFQKYFQKILINITYMLPLALGLYWATGEFFRFQSYNLLTTKVGGTYNDAHKDVLLLLIDENTIKYAGDNGWGGWPFKRDIYRDILDFIHLEGNPKLVFFDILFSEGKNAAEDGVLQQSVAQYGTIVHNILFSYNGELNKPIPLAQDIQDFYGLDIRNPKDISFRDLRVNEYTAPMECMRLSTPCAPVKEKPGAKPAAQKKPFPIAAGLAVANFNPDADTIHRRGRLIFNYDGKSYPAVTMRALQAAAFADAAKKKNPNKPSSYFPGEKLPQVVIENGTDVVVGDYRVPLDNDGNYLINYYTGKRVETISMSAIFQAYAMMEQGRDKDMMIEPKAFKDKIIIIGCSAVGCQDLKAAPMSPVTPGPEIHATMISNALQGNHITFIGTEMEIFLIVLLVGLCLYAVLDLNHIVKQIGIPLLIIAIVFGGAMLLFHIENIFIPFLFYGVVGFFTTGAAFGYKSIVEDKEKRKYRKILGNMVDPSIVKEALNDLESLKKGSEKEITAFFSDVAGFSTISEKLTAAGLADLLNEYLSAMTLVLKKHGGTLDKYIGDAIVGIFNAPIDIPEHAVKAANASIEMIARLAELRAEWKAKNAYCPEAQDMNVRIGLNSGMAKVGFMGTDALASYTMMGDTVNLAARLEAAGKDYGVSVLVSEMFVRNLSQSPNDVVYRLLDCVRVKGKDEPVNIFELIAHKSEIDPALERSLPEYEAGFKAYKNQEWAKAIELFTRSEKTRGQKDKAAHVLIERCEWYQQNPPGQNWDGVFTRTHK